MRFDSGVYHRAGAISDYPPLEGWSRIIDFLEAADFTAAWCAEHHFFWDGWPGRAPGNPIQFCTHFAARTERLRFGQCGVAITDWHPLRVAEDIAMLDHMSRGRVDFGVMPGVNSRVYQNFNPNSDRSDRERHRALFWESLEVIQKAWAGPFTHEGEFYRFPMPGWIDPNKSPDELEREYYSAEGELIKLSTMPTPFQKPAPPSWLMSESVESTVRGIDNGLGVICWGKSLEATRELWTAARAALQAKWGPDAKAHERLGAMRPVFVARTVEEAERVMRPAINTLMGDSSGLTTSWSGRSAFLASYEEITEKDSRGDWYDLMIKCGWCFAGTPEQVTEQLEHFEAELDCRHLLLYWGLPGMTIEENLESLRLFADKVMPNFGSPPAHTSTTL